MYVFKHRKPEQFESQRVLILGGGASGTDIAVEVAGKASKVFSCYAHCTPAATFEFRLLSSASRWFVSSGVFVPQQPSSGLKDA